MVRVSHDTNDAGVIDDARRFAAEAAFASGPQRLRARSTRRAARDRPHALRYDVYNRLRLRLPLLGALDVSYEYFRAPSSQISAFTEPNVFNDVKVDIVGVAWRRAFDLYPGLRRLLDLGYRRVSRVGVVEWYSDLREQINLFEAHPAVSRFLGPDKLTLGMNYVYMQIPTIPGGKLEDRVRARSIRAFYADYAIYRQLLLPDWATRELRRTPPAACTSTAATPWTTRPSASGWSTAATAYGGSACAASGRFDFTVQGTLLSSDTVEDSRDAGDAIFHGLDTSQTVRQLRPTVIGLYRLVDDEAIPDVPPTPLAGLNLVVPVRADFATQGTDAFDNLRGGAELWGKLITTGLRGTHFLVTVGYEAQWFHRVDRLVHLGRGGAAHGLGRPVKAGVLLLVAGCAAGTRAPEPIDPTALVAVGAARYTTAPLGDAPPPSNFAGQPVRPKVTADFAGVPATNDWWSSLIWQYDRDGKANPFSQPLFAIPCRCKRTPAGWACRGRARRRSPGAPTSSPTARTCWSAWRAGGGRDPRAEPRRLGGDGALGERPGGRWSPPSATGSPSPTSRPAAAPAGIPARGGQVRALIGRRRGDRGRGRLRRLRAARGGLEPRRASA
jgi:hypothetical protein